jgi:hypothetical protein
MTPERTPIHWGHAQFHWGKPPPAAEPRTLMRILARRTMTAGRGQGLQLGVGVRANFAVQVDFFVLRGGPFHGRGS